MSNTPVTRRGIMAACAVALANHGIVPTELKYHARAILADRSTTRKNKGANAVKGKHHASLKARANKRK